MRSTGLHIGTGIHKDFVRGEDLRKRQVVVSMMLGSELLDLAEDEDS